MPQGGLQWSPRCQTVQVLFQERRSTLRKNYLTAEKHWPCLQLKHSEDMRRSSNTCVGGFDLWWDTTDLSLQNKGYGYFPHFMINAFSVEALGKVQTVGVFGVRAILARASGKIFVWQFARMAFFTGQGVNIFTEWELDNLETITIRALVGAKNKPNWFQDKRPNQYRQQLTYRSADQLISW